MILIAGSFKADHELADGERGHETDNCHPQVLCQSFCPVSEGKEGGLSILSEVTETSLVSCHLELEYQLLRFQVFSQIGDVVYIFPK